MNMNELAIKACEREVGSNQVNIADMKEIINVINSLTDGTIEKWCQKTNK